MVEQWNTQNPGHYPSSGGNQAHFTSTPTAAYYGSNPGYAGMDNGAVAYPYPYDPSLGHFPPRDNLPEKRMEDLAQHGHIVPGNYQQVPGNHAQPRMGWHGINQGAQYPPGVPVTSGIGGAGFPGGGYFEPGAEPMPVQAPASSNSMASFGEEGPNFIEIPVTVEGKRYLCECGHETKTTGDMARHHETSKHSGSGRYACPCGKRYFRKDGLTRHEKTCPNRNI